MNIPTHEHKLSVLVLQNKYDDIFTMICLEILNGMILPLLYCGDSGLEIRFCFLKLKKLTRDEVEFACQSHNTEKKIPSKRGNIVLIHVIAVRGRR